MTRASQQGPEFVNNMLHKAALPPGREERWKWAMQKTFEQDFYFVTSEEEMIEAMDKVGRFEFSGHSKEIVAKAWKDQHDNTGTSLFLEGRTT